MLKDVNIADTCYIGTHLLEFVNNHFHDTVIVYTRKYHLLHIDYEACI